MWDRSQKRGTSGQGWGAQQVCAEDGGFDRHDIGFAVGVMEVRGDERGEFEAAFRRRDRRLQRAANGAAFGVRHSVFMNVNLDGTPHQERDEEQRQHASDQAPHSFRPSKGSSDRRDPTTEAVRRCIKNCRVGQRSTGSGESGDSGSLAPTHGHQEQ